MRISFAALMVLGLAASASAQSPPTGQELFEENCASCHGEDANGGNFAAGILGRVAELDDGSLQGIVLEGVTALGMPPIDVSNEEAARVIAYLRTLRSPSRGGGGAIPPTRAVETLDGETLEGVVVNESFDDLQLRTEDGRVHLLRREGNAFRPVTSQTDWPTYDGNWRGYRYSEIDQINRENVASLGARWIFTFDDATPLETTPVVYEGIMYVTRGNQCYALDAGSGREIWHYSRPMTEGVTGNGAGGINRGVAVDEDHVYMTTDHAHVIALDRFTGDLVWESVMADWRENYSTTAAPLLVEGLVVAGTAGGDNGARGFLAAWDAKDGREVWRFWTTPLPGEPGSETWMGPDIMHPGAVTWMSGSYDAELGVLYWATGNPGPDHNGDGRIGDNLYSDCVLALDVHTGELLWYYQFTPHDVWDWDAQEPLALIDAEWEGEPRKLLVQANRNGFFYVFDRTEGELLLAKAFAENLTWATGIDENGRPIKVPGQEPNEEGVRVCPSLNGATNWFSTGYHPGTGLYYVQTMESCSIYTKREDDWEAGSWYFGGGTIEAPDLQRYKILRAFDFGTAEPVWELPQVGTGRSRGGVIATASGLVFVAEDSGALLAVDAANGERLWQFQTSQTFRASPMSYMFDGQQYVAISAGPNIIAFGLPD